MHRRLVVLVALLSALVLTACGGGGGSSETEEDGARTVATAFGDVEVPDDPQRVVALGWGDAETALALGVQPVGASDWLAFGGEGVGPWAEGRYDEAPELIGTLEPEFERIAALRPDLILDTKSAGDQARYDALAKIAPTVGIPEGGEQYNTDWRTQVSLVSEALGLAEEGQDLIGETEQSLADAAEANPEFAGKTAVVAALTSEGYGVYVERDSRTQFLKALGFEDSPAVAEIAEDSFSVPVSRENLAVLDGDLTVVIAIGLENEDITSDPLLQQVPSVRDGHLVTFDDRTVSLAFSTNTALSIAYAAEVVPPVLADRL